MRQVKHMSGRSCPADDAKLLAVIPTFPGERITSMRMSAYAASGDDESIDQPGEMNWYGIAIPWAIVWATNLLTNALVSSMDTVPKYDTLFEQWVRSASEAADKYWGGDADVDPEDQAVEEGAGEDALIDSGPIGVHKWFSREKLLIPMAAEGNNVIRFGDEFQATLSNLPKLAFGGLHLFGVMRSEHAAQTTFNVLFDDAVSREGLGLLLSGDFDRVEAKIQGDTAVLGNFIRTVLFGGDYYAEADTLKGMALKCYVKLVATIDSPISRRQ